MAERVTPVRVFISSPGDLFPERDVVKRVVEELNRSPRYLSRYKLIPYAYEDSTPALVGSEPQAVVDTYLLRPEAADIFVGMLWLRMGTPTKALINPETGAPYQSGTEYELLTAYRASQERGWPKILLYRCMRSPDDIDKLDLEQYARVKGLFARFYGGDLRGLVGEFRTNIELAQTLRRDLEQLLEHDLPAREASAPEQAPTPGPIFFVPSSLPSGYIERTEALDTLRKALLGSRETVGVVAAAALHGLGGLGKTVVARAICDDPAVRGAFPDGVLWATLGQNAEPARHQRDWIGALGGDLKAASSLESGKVELSRLLAERAILLVLDDVWNARDAEWLRVGGPRCGVLITTRDATQAEGAALVELELMRRSESRALLRAAGARQIDDALADAIAERLGHLPLALKIAGAMVARRIPWADIAEALDEGDLAFLEHGQSSVLAAIKASVDHLFADRAARYRELVVFPQDEPLDETAVARLWAQTAGLKPRQSRKLLADLRECALVQADNTLHDLQYDYLRAQVPPAERRQLHGALADALSDPATRTPRPDDTYGWQRLAYHLARAERNDDLRGLLHNGAYLQGKIARLGTAALLEDFRLLPGDEEIERMAGALRLGAHILDQEPRELENQLFGRLGSLPELHNMPDDERPRFVLESQTLTAPGGALMRTFVGHTDGVNGCAFSPDGQLTLSASYDHTLRLWNLASGQSLRVLEGHTDRVDSCAISPDSQRALSASGDRTLRLWNLATGQTVCVLEGHTDRVDSCAISPDGQLALSASYDHTLRLWDLTSGQCRRMLEGHTNRVNSCAISPDGQLALSASSDDTLRLWDLTSGQCVRVLEGHTDGVFGCAISPDGQLALSASYDHTLRLWDLTSGQCVRVLEGHRDGVAGCAFSPDGQLALSASWDKTLRLWDLTSGQCVRVLKAHTEEVQSCAFSANGQLALSASSDGTLRLWNLASRQSLRVLEGHSDGVFGCVFSPDGQLALSASFDNTLRLWDLTSGQCVRVLEGHSHWVNGCAFSPDGQLALSASWDNTLRLWNLTSGQCVRVLEGHSHGVTSCAFSPDGQLALSASWDNTLRLWNLTSGQCIRVLEDHSDGVTGCAFSPDGQLAHSASWDKTLQLWDLTNGESVCVLEGHTHGLTGCALSADGQLVLSASYDQTLRLWNLATGQTVRVLEGHSNWVDGCAFSPDGQLALSASWDNTLRLWNLTTGLELACWHADAPLRCCAFHPDGRGVIAGDSLGNLHWLRIEGV